MLRETPHGRQKKNKQTSADQLTNDNNFKISCRWHVGLVTRCYWIWTVRKPGETKSLLATQERLSETVVAGL